MQDIVESWLKVCANFFLQLSSYFWVRVVGVDSYVRNRTIAGMSTIYAAMMWNPVLPKLQLKKCTISLKCSCLAYFVYNSIISQLIINLVFVLWSGSSLMAVPRAHLFLWGHSSSDARGGREIPYCRPILVCFCGLNLPVNVSVTNVEGEGDGVAQIPYHEFYVFAPQCPSSNKRAAL